MKREKRLKQSGRKCLESVGELETMVEEEVWEEASMKDTTAKTMVNLTKATPTQTSAHSATMENMGTLAPPFPNIKNKEIKKIKRKIHLMPTNPTRYGTQLKRKRKINQNLLSKRRKSHSKKQFPHS